MSSLTVQFQKHHRTKYCCLAIVNS